MQSSTSSFQFTNKYLAYVGGIKFPNSHTLKHKVFDQSALCVAVLKESKRGMEIMKLIYNLISKPFTVLRIHYHGSSSYVSRSLPTGGYITCSVSYLQESDIVWCLHQHHRRRVVSVHLTTCAMRGILKSRLFNCTYIRTYELCFIFCRYELSYVCTI